MDNIIEYEEQDYDLACRIVAKGFFMDDDKQTLTLTEENVVDVAKKYYQLRMRTFDPKTGTHL